MARNFICLQQEKNSLELNNFLKTKARQNQSIGFNKIFVAIASGDKAKSVLRFYSLSMNEIKTSRSRSKNVKTGCLNFYEGKRTWKASNGGRNEESSNCIRTEWRICFIS